MSLLILVFPIPNMNEYYKEKVNIELYKNNYVNFIN